MTIKEKALVYGGLVALYAAGVINTLHYWSSL